MTFYTTSKELTPELASKRKEQIRREKRRRHQTYVKLDYLLSNISYFDFFSFDAFEIAKNAKILAQSYNKKVATTEFLLFPFLDEELDISELLIENNLTKKEVRNWILKIHNIPTESTKRPFFVSIFDPLLDSRFGSFFLTNLGFKEEVSIDFSIDFSFEVYLIFEKAAENALERFKTPVITSEILLITMMEEKQRPIGKFFRNFFETDIAWYVFRFKLMKRLYAQEIHIRNNVKRNYDYFTYLLKTQIPEKHFRTLYESKLLDLGVSYFRNNLIREVAKNVDLRKALRTEVFRSMKMTRGQRKYSTPEELAELKERAEKIKQENIQEVWKQLTTDPEKREKAKS